ncbi:MAG: PHP domain-containing protein, partial [Planctomycetota bacterium]
MSDTAALSPLARTVAVVRSRPITACALGGLVVLTIMAVLPFAPEGPFDPRDWSPIHDMRLEFSASGALVEPLASLGHAVAGAPDIRVAALSMLVWVLVMGTAVSLVVALSRGRAPLAVTLRTLGGAGAWLGVFLVWVGFSLLVRLPSWRLAGGSDDVVIADLQSHTFASHDGLVSARESLAWHAARGYDVVAVTEHSDPAGAFEAEALAEMRHIGTGVIPGVERREPGGGYLLGVGLDGTKRPPAMSGSAAGAAAFAEGVRSGHGGATLALAWKLSPEGVRRLAEAGIDGFEIANAGHPDISNDVRAAILEEARARGLVLVASTDWHGWGGFARTWTAVRVPGAPDMTPAEKAKAVVKALRERRAGDVTPVVAGHMGPASTARAVFAPFAELARYAMELTPLRVLAWWVWTAAL